MNSSKLKKAILALLVVIAVYIWGKNLYLFSGGYAAAPKLRGTSVTVSQDDHRQPTASYVEPKINPFRRPDVSAPAVASRKKPVEKRPDPVPTKVSQSFALSGLVNQPPNSQVVLRGRDGTSKVISLGDSIDVWVLTTIASTYAIFTYDKYRDSLALAE